tara:strand:+ start:4654 stop:5163 length:510 start_codon:yes stop_codon:yes gene_type:complete
MAVITNSSFKVKIENVTDAHRIACATEEGALVRTPTGIYAHHGGEHVKIYPQVGSTENVTVNNLTVLGGVNYNVQTITSGKTLDTDDHVIFTNFSTETTVTLPLASTYEGKEYIIRARHNSEKCVLQRSGSDTIDDGGSETSIDINADKSRTLISDGISTWYVVTSIGA